MYLKNLFPAYQDHLNFLTDKATLPSLWQEELERHLKAEKIDFIASTEILDVLHNLQRLRIIFLAGLERDADFRDAYIHLHPPAWKNFVSPPVAEELQSALAQRLYNVEKVKGDIALLKVANGARYVGEVLLDKCIANEIPVFVEIADENFFALILKYADTQAIHALATDYVEVRKPIKKIMAANADPLDSGAVEKDLEKTLLYKKLQSPFVDRVMSGEVFYTLTYVPTPQTAAMDEMDYQEYLTLFFEMCDQPWSFIGKAQAQLINNLNSAKKLRFTNTDGTDISLGIDGFTFCNSLVAKNVPGSEVFSGIEPGTLHGKIISKGRFTPPHDDTAVIENLTLEFEEGTLIRWHADKGQEHFEAAISVDEGAKRPGEIGIGTNSRLHRHVVNGLLVEKIGGSFHIALGHAYTYTKYEGTPVVVDNGNRSKIHWDITTLLFGKEGCMYIDDKKIMENGLFIDAAYDVLNRGWAAVPEAERTDYWKRHPLVLEVAPLRHDLSGSSRVDGLKLT